MTEAITRADYRNEAGRYDSDSELTDIYLRAIVLAGLEIGLSPERIVDFNRAFAKHLHPLVEEAIALPTGQDGLPNHA